MLMQQLQQPPLGAATVLADRCKAKPRPAATHGRSCGHQGKAALKSTLKPSGWMPGSAAQGHNVLLSTYWLRQR